mmetsp:Transcript_44176/g.116981  ORF Transcript_44176/g.116981 Transcript_44176/m.116981 type:complete len:232 (-) Transcript_44176:53-748(-)
MSVLASETQNKVAAVRHSLGTLTAHLEPLLAQDMDDVKGKLTPLQSAELHVGLAFTVASLYFCNLITQGIDPADHPIRQELDRIQMYFKKVKTTAEEITAKSEAKNRVRVDVEAANRIVRHIAVAANAEAQRRTAVRVSAVPKPVVVTVDTEEPKTKKRKRSRTSAAVAVEVVQCPAACAATPSTSAAQRQGGSSKVSKVSTTPAGTDESLGAPCSTTKKRRQVSFSRRTD